MAVWTRISTWVRDPRTQAIVAAMLLATGRGAARVGRLVGWFILTQLVTVVAMALVVTAAWLVSTPLALLVAAVCLAVLERKVEIDRR